MFRWSGRAMLMILEMTFFPLSAGSVLSSMAVSSVWASMSGHRVSIRFESSGSVRSLMSEKEKTCSQVRSASAGVT